MKIGFIGLGIMGAPMAGHLRAGGHDLFVQTRRVVPPELISAGAQSCASATEVARAAEVIFLMLPDTPDVEKVLFGRPGGLGEGLKPGTTVVDMSSISPIATREFAQRIGALGCDYVDAPVSGGEVGARDATLTIMVGASSQAFERVKPLLELMGRKITRVGEVGAGQVTKVANQIVVAQTIAAVGEALLFASKAGVDPAKVREALLGGFAASRVLDVHGERMIKRSFKAGFRVALHQKDLNLALEGARSLGLALPQTAGVAQLMAVAQAQGWDGLDHSSLVRALELMGNHAVAPEPH